ncbi:MAG: ribonuclease HI family protein [Candidatus Aenigmatarchaeota archaeon]
MHEVLYVYTDGGSRGNPGPGAIAVVILDENKKVIAEHKECIGKTTNNRAEYAAMVKAMEMTSRIGSKRLICLSDSKLMVSHLNGDWKVRDDNLRPFFDYIKGVEKTFKKVAYRHIRRCSDQFAKRADELVNEALDSH